MIEEKIESLPLVDAAAFEILRLLNNPAADYARIVEKLSPDEITKQLVDTIAEFHTSQGRPPRRPFFHPKLQ
jgi:hypothetical protein